MIRCSCGNALTYETDICEVCLPNGLMPSSSRPALMTTHDRIISELMDALELIKREAEKSDASRHYMDGVATGAMARCNAQRERNNDGYLVVKASR